ncbi:hypothetical protein DSCOOX_19220 [Desulfosarcina ovata subsp. ovata]|uniref:Uncharacterized protein n=1 Tax=Desulfosarcina ovata subsp. ovata TaxID=2752305 RepID=A0A5K8A7Y7_9BACT|nr:hypothetical protein DSCOOX_19220 [Desulfosarcina ovata subsp. ovata]
MGSGANCGSIIGGADCLKLNFNIRRLGFGFELNGTGTVADEHQCLWVVKVGSGKPERCPR